jgi:hypothetical protein
VSRRTDLRLPDIFEQLLDPALKEQLRAIGGRVYDLVAPAIDEARAGHDDLARLRPLSDAHAMAVAVFESECLGYFHNVPGGLDLLNSLACKAGCTFCCELKVEVTGLEAAVLWGMVSRDRADRRQPILDTAPRTAGQDTEARRVARIPCALLANGQCSAYTVRPYACRGMFATDAQDCERVLTTPAGLPLPPVRSPAVPRALSAAFASGVNAAQADSGLQHEFFELHSALATLLDRPDALQAWLSGERVFTPAVPG